MHERKQKPERETTNSALSLEQRRSVVPPEVCVCVCVWWEQKGTCGTLKAEDQNNKYVKMGCEEERKRDSKRVEVQK
jgi:hypothetical protein